jgi:hypothetical protein
MLFELNNPSAGRVTHCGVLEFIADEGLVFLPYWVCFLALLSFKCCGSSDVLLLIKCCLFFLFFFLLLDDEKHVTTRGRRSASEECQSSKGNICEAATTHKGFLRYLQPQSNVS